MKRRLAVLWGAFLWLGLSCLSVADAQERPRDKNRLGMSLVLIPAGEYQRGVVDERRLESMHPHTQQMGADLMDERPAHPVGLTREFWIGTHEVTVGQFRAFVQAANYQTDAETSRRGALMFNPSEKESPQRFLLSADASWQNPGFAQQDDHPVTCVSHRDAVAFCEWLSQQEQATYRLPTEAEWEYAARAGTNTTYVSGDGPDRLPQYGNIGDATLEAAHPGTVKRQQVAHLSPQDGDGFVYTAPAGSLQPNAWGLYDTHGNVWEWCSDRYHDRYYEELTRVARQKGSWAKPAVTLDPRGPESTPQHQFGDWRSKRGGCWYSGPMASRSASRAFGAATDAFCYTGFRVVREIKN